MDTQRDSAAVSQRDIASWLIGGTRRTSHCFAELVKAPPSMTGDYKARSPITYIKNVTTL